MHRRVDEVELYENNALGYKHDVQACKYDVELYKYDKPE